MLYQPLTGGNAPSVPETARPIVAASTQPVHAQYMTTIDPNVANAQPSVPPQPYHVQHPQTDVKHQHPTGNYPQQHPYTPQYPYPQQHPAANYPQHESAGYYPYHQYPVGQYPQQHHMIPHEAVDTYLPPRFLGCCATPAKTAFFGSSLRSSLIAIMSLLYVSLILGIFCQGYLFLSDDDMDAKYYISLGLTVAIGINKIIAASCLGSVVSMESLPFALLVIRSIIKIMILRTGLLIVALLNLFALIHNKDADANVLLNETTHHIWEIGFVAVSHCYLLYVIYVVWSFIHRAKRGEQHLIRHGVAEQGAIITGTV